MFLMLFFVIFIIVTKYTAVVKSVIIWKCQSDDQTMDSAGLIPRD